MSVEGMAPIEAGNTPTIDSEVEVSQDDKLDSDINPNDIEGSYERWLAKQNKAEEKVESKIPQQKENGKKDSEDLVKIHVKEEPKQVEKQDKEEASETKLPQKIKVGGKEYQEEELIKELASVKETSAKLQQLQSQAEQLVEMLKKNPGTVLDRVGANKEAFEQWYYENYIEPTLLTPEQRQAKQDRARVEAYEKAEAERRTREESEAQERLKKQYQEEFTRQISEGLKQSGMPETDWTRNQAAKHLRQFITDKRPVQMTEIMTKVKNDWIELQKSIVAHLPPEQLIEQLGEDTISKLRAHDVAKFKQDKFENKKPIIAESKSKQSKQKEKIKSVYDILDRL